MIVEHRTYQLKTSAVGRYFEDFGRAGFDLQAEYAGRCVGHYVTEVGPHSQVLALWSYDSFETRMRGRARLQQNEQWRDIVDRVSPLIHSIETKLLVRSPVWGA